LPGHAKMNVRGNLITTYRYQRGNHRKNKLISLVPDDLTRGKPQTIAWRFMGDVRKNAITRRVVWPWDGHQTGVSSLFSEFPRFM